MKLVVGLGNPGRKYAGTRHNVGFDVIGELARRYQAGRPKAKFSGEVAETIIQNRKTILICPLTYMNLSGRCVRAAVDFYKLELDDLLIICDDFNLPVGRIRLRPKGSDGGQNGLSDVIRQLGSQDFGRLRLGIGRPPAGWDVPSYVTGKFSDHDREVMELAIPRAADATEVWLVDGMQQAMSQFNADPEKMSQSRSRGQRTPEDAGPADRPTENSISNTEKKPAN